MKVLIVSTSLQGGGAAIAAVRLFEALVDTGVDARLLCLDGKIEGQRYSDRVEVLTTSVRIKWKFMWAKLKERLCIAFTVFPNLSNLWRLSLACCGVDISNHQWVREADVIHLHWVHHGFLSILGLQKLAALHKPIVCTLHDLWYATGGCHLPLRWSSVSCSICERYTDGCGNCPLIGVAPLDFTRKLRLRKQFILRSPFHYIAVSRCESRLFQQGTGLMADVIAPPINLADYRTNDNFFPSWYEEDALYILISAARLDDDVKGYSLLNVVMSDLVRKCQADILSRIRLILVGRVKKRQTFSKLAVRHLLLGEVSGSQMKLLYKIAKVVISTSLFETFGQTLIESLASGVPVVSFACGGPEDIIQSGINGELVEAYDTDQMADAICKVLLGRLAGGYTTELCQHSVSKFSTLEISQKHVEYYKTLL